MSTTSTPNAFSTRRPRTVTRGALAQVALALALLLTACKGGADRLRAALKPAPPDPQWVTDSTLLSMKPDVLFRVLPANGGDVAIPIATIGSKGMRELRMGSRGWRAFDATYMFSTQSLFAYRDGASLGPVRMLRGMWEQAQPVDSLQGCGAMVPVARVTPTPGVRLLAAKYHTMKNVGDRLSDAAMADVLDRATQLIAPTVGITPVLLRRFKRQIYQVPTAVAGAPAVVMIFNDPQQLPETTSTVAQRARHLIAILDKGEYGGYRPTYVFSSIGVRNDSPRMKLVDFLDVDGNGVPEIFLTPIDEKFDTYIVGLKYTTDAWREFYRSRRMRCDI